MICCVIFISGFVWWVVWCLMCMCVLMCCRCFVLSMGLVWIGGSGWCCGVCWDWWKLMCLCMCMLI